MNVFSSSIRLSVAGLVLASLVLAIIAAGCAGQSMATRNISLSYDMAANTVQIVPTERAKAGDMVSFEVKNVNPFLYEVTINQQRISRNTPLRRLQQFALPKPNIGDTARQAPPLTADLAGSTNRLPINRFRTNHTLFRNRFNTFVAFLSFDDYLLSLLRQPFPQEDLLKRSITARLNELVGTGPLYTRADFVRKGDELFEAMTKSFNDLMSEYQFLDTLAKRELREAMLNARATYESFAAGGEWSHHIEATADLYELVQNTPFTFASFRTQVAIGDQAMTFRVEGTRKEEADQIPNGVAQPFALQYQLPVEGGGFRLGIGAGLFASSLANNSYGFRDSLGYRFIVQNQRDVMNYGPGAVMHFHHTAIPIGGNVGLMLNNASRIQYLAGASLMLGDRGQIGINGGLTFGTVSRLAAPYILDKRLDGNDAKLTAIPTIDRLELGWYGGVSYNFGGSN
ncbi:MAG: hypothetical protein IPM61_04690 [Chlorobi bacterium]|nr:hypothetical protein [Chlorobiota bacterium]MBX7216181.1 hypothetical protein [Candidatus Kapabacteria bacterium]